MKKDFNIHRIKRGPKFVLGFGTKVFRDKKKQCNKNQCRQKDD